MARKGALHTQAVAGTAFIILQGVWGTCRLDTTHQAVCGYKRRQTEFAETLGRLEQRPASREKRHKVCTAFGLASRELGGDNPETLASEGFCEEVATQSWAVEIGAFTSLGGELWMAATQPQEGKRRRHLRI